MDNERASLEDFKMKRNADEAELKKKIPGTIVVDCRWHLHRKKSKQKVKARVIARQVKHFNDGLDTFAATATSAGTRALIALLADYNAAGGDWVATFGDVKTAFLHAALPPERRVFLRPPSTEPERLWRAQKALYGLREAPR
eukprot:7679129-Heterocapsa_arctica.AAC.1